MHLANIAGNDYARIPLNKMLQAVYLMCASKKGVSAHQLHRILEVQYRTPWFLSHRIREAMRSGELAPMGGAGGIVEVHGALQGVIHSLVKEAARPHFQVRELATDSVVRCYYNSSQYDAIIRVLKQRTAVVHVAGDITYDRVTRSALELRVDRIEEAGILTPAQFEQLVGSMPDFTGGVDTDEYLDAMGGNG